MRADHRCARARTHSSACRAVRAPQQAQCSAQMRTARTFTSDVFPAALRPMSDSSISSLKKRLRGVEWEVRLAAWARRSSREKMHTAIPPHGRTCATSPAGIATGRTPWRLIHFGDALNLSGWRLRFSRLNLSTSRAAGGLNRGHDATAFSKNSAPQKIKRCFMRVPENLSYLMT